MMRPDDRFADIDTKTPSGARVYDYMLGGSDNYAVDRMAAEQAERMMPGTMALARNNRRYMERVVRYLARDCGIRQFIDNGSGLPTRSNVHHIAQAIDPGSRVIYIDCDPVVLRHQKVSALAENENTAFVLADATKVEEILGHPETRRLLDPGQPAAALYLTFLHFIPDEADPWGMVRQMMGRLAPGSYLAVSQIVSDHAEVRRRMTEFALAHHARELRPVPQEAGGPPVLRGPGGGRTRAGQHQRLAPRRARRTAVHPVDRVRRRRTQASLTQVHVVLGPVSRRAPVTGLLRRVRAVA